MAKYFFDYTDTVIGANLGGVTLRSGGAPTYMPIYGAPAFKKRYLNFVSDVATNRTFTHNAVDADAVRADFDLLTCVAISDTTAFSAWLIARASGTASMTGYAAILVPSSNVIQLFKSTTGTLVGLTAVSVTFTPGKSYFFRFRGSGSTLSVKAWASDVDEPGYSIVVTDTTFTTAGSVGVGLTATAASQVAPFNFLSVGTGGDVAQLPLTNARYTAWLSNQTARREVLTEFSATGYDSANSPTFLKTSNVYLSRYGFVSKPWDTPANRAYPALIKSIPTFSQKMPAGLTGEAVTGFGDLVLDNNLNLPSRGAGELALDSWLRVRWNKSFIRVYLGDPNWPRHDFRAIIVGRVGKPTAPSATTIALKIQNLSAAFAVPMTTQKFTSGQYLGAFKPVLIGSFSGYYGSYPLGFNGAFFEPPLSDKSTNTVTISDGPITYTDGNSQASTVLDNLKSVGTVPGLTILSVNMASGVLTSAAHGMVVNYRVRFFAFGSAPPAPFMANVDYFVISAGLTTATFSLSATQGGSAIIPTNTAAGAQFDGYGYTVNASAGTVTFAAALAGRVIVTNFSQTSGSSFDNLYARSGLSNDFKDQKSFAAYSLLTNAYGGLFYPPGSTLVAQGFADHANFTLSWYGFTPDGLMRVGILKLPAASASASFTSADFAKNAIKMVDEIPAVDFTKSELTYAKWFLTGGAFQSNDALALQGKTYYTNGTYSGSTPLDLRPDRLDSNVTASFNLIVAQLNDGDRIVTLFKQRLGIYEVPLTLRAIEVSVGDTISLEDNRMGFRLWTSAAPASADNANTIDSRLCVVVGIDVNLNGGAFPVTLTLMRQVPGYYPQQDLT